MVSSPFWRSKDTNGLVHPTLSTSYPVLGRDNDVDYEDGETTFCNQFIVSDWTTCSDDTPITCIACLAGLFKLEAAAFTYLESRRGDPCA